MLLWAPGLWHPNPSGSETLNVLLSRQGLIVSGQVLALGQGCLMKLSHLAGRSLQAEWAGVVLQVRCTAVWTGSTKEAATWKDIAALNQSIRLQLGAAPYNAVRSLALCCETLPTWLFLEVIPLQEPANHKYQSTCQRWGVMIISPSYVSHSSAPSAPTNHPPEWFGCQQWTSPVPWGTDWDAGQELRLLNNKKPL